MCIKMKSKTILFFGSTENGNFATIQIEIY